MKQLGKYSTQSIEDLNTESVEKPLEKYNAQELEDELNSRLVERANLNERLIEICRVIEKKGLGLKPDNREYSGKYFLVVEAGEKE